MAAKHITQLERVRYWEGQLLASGDLQTQMRVAAELRRQHNRAVHSAFGVAIGLAVSDIADGKLPVSCGLAYDCSGRGLPVWEDTAVPLPSAAITAPTLLTISYDADTGDALLAWRKQGLPMASDSVAIARILPGPPVALDPAFRPVIARPLARPQIAAGQTVPGDTAWTDWNDDAGVSIGVQTVVDTSASGFTTAPNYFAEAVTDNATADFQPAWFTSIADPAADQFTLRLFLRRITREALQIVDPHGQLAATPAAGGSLTLDTGNVFAQYDQASRLLPVADSASMVTALSGNTATLDNPIPALTAAGLVAFGNPPRIANVVTVGAAGTVVQITVDTPDNFASPNVVAKLGAAGMTRPTTVTAVADDGGIELANPIQGLSAGDSLGVAQAGSPVTAVAGTSVTVQNAAGFHVNDIVVSLDTPVENFPTAMITGIAGNVLTLGTPIAGLTTASTLAPVHQAGTVATVTVSMNEVKVQLDSVKMFREGDLLSRVTPGGAFTEPVRIQAVQSSTKKVTLSQAIPGLAAGDQVASADFRVRATVLAVSGVIVTVASPSHFPAGSFVTILDDSYTPAGISAVSSTTSTTVVLTTLLGGLAAGNILALCSFPALATVQSIAPDGTLFVTPSGAIHTGDMVAALPAHPGMSMVAAASASSLQLAAPIAGLAAGDVLSVVTIGGAVNATPGASPTKVTLDAGNRVRVGDFLAAIAGWREPGPGRSIAWVVNTSGTSVTLSNQLDGIMIHDTVGMASLTAGLLGLELRLSKAADLRPGDEVLLAGLDRLTGQTASMFAIVEFLLPAQNQVFLAIEGSPGPFTIRPIDVTASVLFVRGSALALVQNQGLYVSWLACQDPDPMPRPCTDSGDPVGPCGEAAQL